VLCDAGGGTVVSLLQLTTAVFANLCFHRTWFHIKWRNSNLLPLNVLRIQRVRETDKLLRVGQRLIGTLGAKCGSIYIDGNFKRWLHRLLGEEHYRRLDPRNAGQKISAHDTEGQYMREIMKAFDPHKRSFPKDGKDMKIDLTEPILANLSIDGKVVEGEFTITQFDSLDH
jgi:hypothetical protein